MQLVLIGAGVGAGTALMFASFVAALFNLILSFSSPDRPSERIRVHLVATGGMLAGMVLVASGVLVAYASA